ncbi:MAG: prevent-host-death protein [Bacteroidales bacterium]|nr:prevent-host-death protein [Bacteroidales bacterium]
MLVISSKEFRDNQKSYLDKIDEGIEVVLQRGKDKAYRILPVKKDDTLMSKEEFFAKIDKSLTEAREGNLETFNTVESLKNFLETL